MFPEDDPDTVALRQCMLLCTFGPLCPGDVRGVLLAIFYRSSGSCTRTLEVKQVTTSIVFYRECRPLGEGVFQDLVVGSRPSSGPIYTIGKSEVSSRQISRSAISSWQSAVS